MKLGAFSISLAVKDIHVSNAFYEKLGFSKMGGDIEQKWLILKNTDGTIIGLFEGMFEKNLMTFNPGWDKDATELEDFDDIRKIQQKLMSSGIEVKEPIDESSTGVAHFMIEDPDGNPILLDQHRE
ncbi:VOC family protein [Glaciecola sp.]|jgi:lactoylglutathione lyase|uniref:VOC family protein n=1 Tax=Glaciecola sp. MF2-115 TaxID=3384827 RepID=UPI0016D83223|mmetsp:Transcript_59286/g.189049  ORF Transcript_59286/g.189049 Transcript_59286/m.189049 type:complete len:126 (+) Transcript_59286:80-457(+)